MAEEKKTDTSAIQIAVIGMIGAIIGGAISNWDKILPEKRKTETPQVIQRETEAREAAAAAEMVKVHAEAARAKAEAEKALMEAKKIQREMEEEVARKEKEHQEEIMRIERERKQANINSRAKIFAKEAAPTIVKKYWMGGSDISATVQKARYDESSGTYEIEISMRWFGIFFKNNEYWADGILFVSNDGSFKFTKTSASSSLRDVESAIGFVQLGILAGATGNTTN